MTKSVNLPDFGDNRGCEFFADAGNGLHPLARGNLRRKCSNLFLQSSNVLMIYGQ